MTTIKTRAATAGGFRQGASLKNKFVLLAAASALIAGAASAHAESRHVSKQHQRLMSSHARMQGPETATPRGGYTPGFAAPQTGYYGGSGRMDDPAAEGRTSGG